MNIDVATTRLLRVLLIGGTIVFAMSIAADVFKPLALAILVTFLLAPLAGRLERLGMSRVFSVATVLLVVTAVIGATGYVVGNQFSSLAQDVPKYVENIQNKILRLRPAEESTTTKVMDAVAKLTKANAEAGPEPPAQPSSVSIMSLRCAILDD